MDEAQFFDPGIVEVCQRIADQGKRVIVAGLDKDFRERRSARSRRSWPWPKT